MLRVPRKPRFAKQVSARRSVLSVHHRPLRCEMLEDRRLLSIGGYAELPGMVLVDPVENQFEGQVSADGDKFKSYEDSVRLRARNSIYTLRAKKFDTVLGDAGSGGDDTTDIAEHDFDLLLNGWDE